MREILFRGKRTDTGEWVQGYLVRRPSACCIGAHNPWAIIVPPRDPDDDTGQYFVEPDSVGQYTGVRDINGKMIFEHDIVAYEDSDGGYEYPAAVMNTGEILYADFGFYVTNSQSVGIDDFYVSSGACADIEVIGTAFDLGWEDNCWMGPGTDDALNGG